MSSNQSTQLSASEWRAYMFMMDISWPSTLSNLIYYAFHALDKSKSPTKWMRLMESYIQIPLFRAPSSFGLLLYATTTS